MSTGGVEDQHFCRCISIIMLIDRGIWWFVATSRETVVGGNNSGAVVSINVSIECATRAKHKCSRKLREQHNGAAVLPMAAEAL
jgi:hypothetical protein